MASKLFDWVAEKIIERAKKTPYIHLDGYMNRYWLFNPYQNQDGTHVKKNWLMSKLPSIRVHHILREDDDRHLHDHPWDARTIILKGQYKEVREGRDFGSFTEMKEFTRREGDTAKVNFGEYHRITEVTEGGVYTLFITYKYMGTWGFKVNGKKVPYKEYLADK